MIANLTDREKEILRCVVENFIFNAVPVGSRNISKQSDLNLSPATIRNVMSDLEEMELLKTPHTSAGRVPTDKAYRYYIDTLMGKEILQDAEIRSIKHQINELKNTVNEPEEIFSETSKILGKISHMLAVVSEPLLTTGIFAKLELVSLSSTKILAVLNIRSGIVKTLILELDSEILKSKLDRISSLLNERLSGLTLKEIKETFTQRIGDLKSESPELIQLFINTIDKFYDEERGGKIYLGGTSEIISQPEFIDMKNVKSIINLTEDRNFVVHIFQNSDLLNQNVSIKIGDENADDKLKDLSVLATAYSFGDVKGKIGVIGPKRMNYAKMITLLEYTSKLITEMVM
jgi:heat-inducible transcriptional repressor